MKKIGLLSDTHGYLDPKIFEHFKGVDEIWHAGDVGNIEIIHQLEQFKPTRGVFGNIDDAKLRSFWKAHNAFMCEDMKVLISHIGGKPYKYRQQSYGQILKEKPDIFVCGHSHICLVQFDKNINALWLNPGACGYKGFHKVKTILRFDIDGKQVKNMEVIELGKRV
ncbi:MAG TPA: metallophosphoesterase [Crocinitomix sp.]|nr:metallophosphoesterase [Crocinitomix sp.]